jgi:dienelactone hydrolase
MTRFATQLQSLGWVAFASDYRLDVPAGHPAEVQDVLRAVSWVRENAARFHVDPTRIALFGASAGANLAALAAVLPTGPLTSGERVLGVVSLSGPMDLTALADGTAEARYDLPKVVADYLGCAPTSCADLSADASPVHHVDSGDPPMILFNSTQERIPLVQATSMEARLRAAGVPVEVKAFPGNRHAHAIAADAWVDAVHFLQRRFGQPETEVAPLPDGARAGGASASRSDATRGQAANCPSSTTAPLNKKLAKRCARQAATTDAVPAQKKSDASDEWTAAAVAVVAASIAIVAAVVTVVRSSRAAVPADAADAADPPPD